MSNVRKPKPVKKRPTPNKAFKNNNGKLLMFPSRFDDAYLAELLHLIENAEATAIRRKKIYKGKTFKKCIEFNFAGISGSTLLGNSRGFGKRNSKMWKKVVDAFNDLLSEENLERLNNKGIYVRIRFAYSYPFSDHPICLMVSEKEENWHNRIIKGKPEAKYDFHKIPPLDRNLFTNSTIYKSQLDALQKIAELCDRNKEQLNLGRPNSAANTMQVRWPVIPNTLCTIIINGKYSISDPYMYAPRTQSDGILVYYPVVIAKKGCKQYNSVVKNFNYIWRHDVTLYDEDCTRVKEEGNGLLGLTVFREPLNAKGKCILPFRNKEKRIRERRTEDRHHEHFLDVTEQDIADWRNNLAGKLELNVSKLPPGKDVFPSPDVKSGSDIKRRITSLDIGIKLVDGRCKYSFAVVCNDGMVAVDDNVHLSFSFNYLLHAAYKRVKGVQHTVSKAKGESDVPESDVSKVKGQVVEFINNRAQNGVINRNDLFEDTNGEILLRLDAAIITLTGEELFGNLEKIYTQGWKITRFEAHLAKNLKGVYNKAKTKKGDKK